MTKTSELEEALLGQMRMLRLPEPERQFRFCPPRRFRFDFSWPDRKIAVEVDGGIWINGRHNRGSGLVKEAEKYSLAAINGWRVLRVTADQIDSGEAVTWLESVLKGEK